MVEPGLDCAPFPSRTRFAGVLPVRRCTAQMGKVAGCRSVHCAFSRVSVASVSRGVSVCERNVNVSRVLREHCHWVSLVALRNERNILSMQPHIA